VNVLDNPAKLDQPFKIEITFEVFENIKEEVEWELVFVASDGKEERDQLLDSVGIGPIREGRHKFIFDAPAPVPASLTVEDLTDVTLLLLKCKFRDQLFVKIGWFITHAYDKETDPELFEDPPVQPIVEKLQRIISIDDVRVTYYAIKWDDDPVEASDDEEGIAKELENLEPLTHENQNPAPEITTANME